MRRSSLEWLCCFIAVVQRAARPSRCPALDGESRPSSITRRDFRARSKDESGSWATGHRPVGRIRSTPTPAPAISDMSRSGHSGSCFSQALGTSGSALFVLRSTAWRNVRRLVDFCALSAPLRRSEHDRVYESACQAELLRPIKADLDNLVCCILAIIGVVGQDRSPLVSLGPNRLALGDARHGNGSGHSETARRSVS